MAVKIRKKRKVCQMRGQRWHGWGGKKKHRGAGSRGGKGRAGYHKHKYSYVVAIDPDHYGYKGFVPPGKYMKKKIINLDGLQKIVDKQKITEIDLGGLGFTKLLSRGEIKTKITVKVDDYSMAAKKAIEKVG
ncbi:MAG: uL15m family ribosomal protein, partial [Candidatus Aenigmatarchaeota archaeon]